MSVRGLRLVIAVTTCVSALLAPGGGAFAQTASPPAQPDKPATAPPSKDTAKPATRALRGHCIPLRRVRSIQIVDARTVIWTMRAGTPKFYKMTLASKCPGLMVRGAFVHSSSNGQLCDVGEWIRVAGGSRAICPIQHIEPWDPPADNDAAKSAPKDGPPK